MKIDLTNGRATVDAHDLGPLLGLAPKDIPTLMRNGDITSRFEKGIDDDLGRIRLIFYHHGKRVRLTCDTDGNVTSTSTTPARI